MCFNVTSPVKTATRDIIGYKALVKTGTGKLNSPIYRSTWRKGVPKTVVFFDIHRDYGDNVSEGLHLFRTKARAKRSMYGDKIYKVMIPKGTKYYTNKYQYCAQKAVLVALTPVN